MAAPTESDAGFMAITSDDDRPSSPQGPSRILSPRGRRNYPSQTNSPESSISALPSPNLQASFHPTSEATPPRTNSGGSGSGKNLDMTNNETTKSKFSSPI